MNRTGFKADTSESEASVEMLPISAVLLLASLHIGGPTTKQIENRIMYKARYHGICQCPQSQVLRIKNYSIYTLLFQVLWLSL